MAGERIQEFIGNGVVKTSYAGDKIYSNEADENSYDSINVYKQ